MLASLGQSASAHSTRRRRRGSIHHSRTGLQRPRHRPARLSDGKTQTDAIFSAKSPIWMPFVSSISSDITDADNLDTDPTVFDPMVADARARSRRRPRWQANGDPLPLSGICAWPGDFRRCARPLRTKEEAYQKAHAAAETDLLGDRGPNWRYVQGRRGAIDLNVRSTLNDAETPPSAARRARRGSRRCDVPCNERARPRR